MGRASPHSKGFGEPPFNLHSSRGSQCLRGPKPPLLMSTTCRASGNAGVESSSASASLVNPSFSSASTRYSHSPSLSLPPHAGTTGAIRAPAHAEAGACSPAVAGAARPTLPAAAPRHETPCIIQQSWAAQLGGCSMGELSCAPRTKPRWGGCRGDRDGLRMLPDSGFKPA